MIYKAVTKDTKEYYSNYNLLVQFDYRHKTVLNSDFTQCFFCGKSKDKVTFSNDSHAVSKLLGSKLFTKDECDSCNETFGKSFENKLGLFLNFFKSIFGNSTYKDSITKIKNVNSEIQINSKIKKIDPENMRIHFETISPERWNIDIYFALLKMSLSTFPRSRKNEIKKAITLLNGEKNLRKVMMKSDQFFIWGMNDENCSEKRIEIYEYLGEERYPKFICWIQFERFFFQHYIPFTCNQKPYLEELNILPLKEIVYSSNQKQFVPQTSIEYVKRKVPKGRTENAIQALDSKQFQEFLKKIS